jgi:LacI family transcriptional regulator, galactose operon repressor
MPSEMILEPGGASRGEKAFVRGRLNAKAPVLRATAGRQIPRVGLFIESSRASGRSLLGGIARYAHDHGRWSFFWEPGGLEKAWPRLRSLALDGIILRDVDKLDEVLSLGFPAVVVGHNRTEVSGLVNVTTDSETIAHMAAEHLLSCGFKQFAYCGFVAAATDKASWSQLRLQSFSKRIRQAGFPCYIYPSVACAGSSWPRERRAMTQWLQSLPKPIGLMACNDDRAQQVVEACKLAGVSVPDDVGVIGVDNDEVVCGLSDPPLSSIAVNFERAGYEAAKALAQLLRGKRTVPQRIVVVATHVLVRRSTDFVATDDVHLAKALRSIRDSAGQHGVGVADVARAAGLSRRALEMRFRNQLNRSILDEIRRVRTDQIARLLAETDMTVSQIADLLGFEDTHHFARYFRAAKKMSPLAYRQTHGKSVV